MSLPVLRDVVDNLDVLICGLDAGGTILVFNRSCERTTGIVRTDAIGTRWLDLFARDERQDHVLRLWDQATPERSVGPYEAVCRNGRHLRWQFTRWDRTAPAPVQVWAVGVDLTRDREAQARAREHERVVAVGNLLSGLTHELRNPLNSALLQLQLATRATARDDGGAVTPAAEAILRATSEVRRISSILDDFLVFARPIPIHLERIEVRTVAARAIDRAQPRAAAAGVAIALEPGVQALAEVDPARVETAVYHLIANAIDAAKAAATAEIRVRIAVESNLVAIEVEDHGAGIPAPAARIFDPYFTTKQGGSGLGLSIVQRVAVDHAGQITHQRRDDATVFRLELPIAGGATN